MRLLHRSVRSSRITLLLATGVAVVIATGSALTPTASAATPRFQVGLHYSVYSYKGHPTAVVGHVVTLQGTVTPSTPDRRVLVEMDSGSGWTTIARPRLSLFSAYTQRWEIPRGGTFRFRVVKPGDAGRRQGLSRTLTIKTAARLAITTTSLADGAVGTPYRDAITVSGGRAPVRFTASGLPAGLTMTGGGVIEGTPTAKTSALVRVVATDAVGQRVRSLLPWTSDRVPGSVYGWGQGGIDGGEDQLGLGNDAVLDVPAQLNLSDVTQVSGGSDASYALDSHGQVWAWGASYAAHMPNAPQQVEGLLDIVQVAPGVDGDYALDSTGHVWGWDASDGTAPAQLDGLSGITHIAAGAEAAYAVDSQGHVWAWGYGGRGALGDGSTQSSQVPVEVSGLSGITQVSGGFDYAAALDSAGHVWVWGSGADGELGDGSRKDTHVPVELTSLPAITQVSLSYGVSYALDSQGHVWSWGWGGNGDLGNGARKTSDVPVEVSALSGISQISAGFGSSSTYALDGQGRVWSWGSGYYGTLGDGTRTDSDVPVRVRGLSGIAQVSAGDYTAYALQGPVG